MTKKKKNIYRKWSNEEIKLLKKLFPIKKTKELAEILEKTTDAVSYKAQMMGLKKVGRQKWSDNEIKLLKEIFPVKLSKEVAEILGKTVDSVSYKAQMMGLKKRK